MKALTEAAFGRTRTTLSLLTVLVLAGIMARTALPIANDPHIELPFFYVGVIHEGISPEDAERLLVQPMETELRKLEGLVELRSTAAEGMASFFVEFDVSQDLDNAIAEVREAVNRARAEMPGTAEEPFVEELTVDDFPMLQINFIGRESSERSVYRAALKLRDDIESIPSVLSADLQGQREEVLEIIIEPDALNAYRISAESLIATLQRNNRLIPAGSIDMEEGRFAVKVPAVVERADHVLDLPIQTSGDTVVTLKDVASVHRTFKDRTSFARYNGRDALSIGVKKRANANVIDSVTEVLEVVDAARGGLPAGIELIVSQNKAEFAEIQVRELEGNILTALALVMVLVVAAMGFRSGLIVGLGIPFSLLFSVIIIYLLGYTFNFMVMFGMLLGLGMLIDGGIVVTEYANRMMAEGRDHKTAYTEAVWRMFWPVTASTATTLAAFLPMLFWPGVSGQFMGYLPVTVFTVLVGSLLYALLFGPVLGSLIGRPSMHTVRVSENQATLERGDPTRLPTLTGKFARLLTWVCGAPDHHPGRYGRPAVRGFLGLWEIRCGHHILLGRRSPVRPGLGTGSGQLLRHRGQPAGAGGGGRGSAGTRYPVRQYRDHAAGRRRRRSGQQRGSNRIDFPGTAARGRAGPARQRHHPADSRADHPPGGHPGGDTAARKRAPGGQADPDRVYLPGTRIAGTDHGAGQGLYGHPSGTGGYR